MKFRVTMDLETHPDFKASPEIIVALLESVLPVDQVFEYDIPGSDEVAHMAFTSVDGITIGVGE